MESKTQLVIIFWSRETQEHNWAKHWDVYLQEQKNNNIISIVDADLISVFKNLSILLLT